MSDNAKKPGARDISDLKARLGLKKGAEAGRQSGSQGVVPPPGAARMTGTYVPPPPGVNPPPGAPGHVPDATVDPFGAMNAMAAHGATRAQPEIIIVNDGKPVESVQKKSSLLGIMRTFAVVAIPLAVGFAIGGINYERKQVGLTIRDAGYLHGEFADVGKRLQTLQDSLYKAKDNDAKAFLLNDMSLIETLEATDLGIPQGDEGNLIIYHAHLYSMDPKVVGDVLRFYSQLKTLQDRVREFGKRMKNNSALAAPDAIKPVGSVSSLAAIVRSPPGQGGQPPPPPFVEIVQVGLPICGKDMRPGTPRGCEDKSAPVGFQFRTDTGAPFGSKEVAQPITDGMVTPDKLIGLNQPDPRIPLSILSTIVKGSAKTFEELEYFTRLQEIEAMTENLMGMRKDIENRMNTVAQRSKPFAL